MDVLGEKVREGAKSFLALLEKKYKKSSLLDKYADYFIKKLAFFASLPARFFIFLLVFNKKQDFSSFHKIQQDELWHFYEGSTLQMLYRFNWKLSIRLGRNLEQGEQMQYTVPRHTWMAAEVIDKTSYSLIGATVSPGFDFADFEMPTAETLINQYPQHQKIISRLTIHNNREHFLGLVFYQKYFKL